MALGAVEALRVPVLAHRANVVVVKRGEGGKKERKVRKRGEKSIWQIALNTSQ